MLKTDAPTLLIVTLISMSGCDDRATQIALKAADHQAQQNRTVTELNKEVAAGARRLVEADAKTRQEIVEVHRDLQAERTRLDGGWTVLEEERRHVAAVRRRESLLVPVAYAVGGVAIVVVLMGFCWNVLAADESDPADAQLNELLISDILGDEPHLLPSHYGTQSLLE